MNLNWKTIGIISLFIAAVALFAFFIYYFFFKPIFISEELPTVNINEESISQGLPSTININGRTVTENNNQGLPSRININAEPVITQPTATAQGGTVQTNAITTEPAYYVTTDSASQLIYYNPKTGKFYRVSAEGEVSAYSDKIFHNVQGVTWSNQKNKAILEYPDGSKIIYDFDTGDQVTLPKHWQEFNFSPSDQNIAFKSYGLDPENRFLVVAKNDGSQAQVIERLGNVGDQFDVNWSPNNQMIATFTKGKDLRRSEVYFIGLNNENFKLMTVEGRDFRGQWSPKGDKMVYSVYNSQNDYKPELWVADIKPGAIGNNRRRIDLQTWGDKCAFSNNDRLFCAVPKELPFGAGMDSSVASNIADNIYEINLRTGTKKLIATPDSDHTIGQIILTENTGNLFFTDINNGMIYKIKL